MTMFVLGFTGTQFCMTMAQRTMLRTLLTNTLAGRLPAGPDGVEGHHGDCIGADKEFHLLCKERGWRTVGHPPDNNVKRAFCDFDEMREPKPYLERNKDIVVECTLLIACPAQCVEVRRSGTWSTVRYARKVGRPYIVVDPNGSYTGGWQAGMR